MADRYELAFLKNALGVNFTIDPQEQTALESLIFQRLLTGNFKIDNSGAITITLNGLQLADGTAGAPALTFVNEPTTGRYRIGAGDVGETVLGLKVLDWTGTRLQLTGLNLIFSPDNSEDIGASGANRPRDLFLGRNASIGGTLDVQGGLNASQLLTGTVADARLSPNVPLKNVTNTFTAAQVITGGSLQVGSVVGLGQPGDIIASRGGAPPAGVINLGDASHYLTWNGTTTFSLVGGPLSIPAGQIAFPATPAPSANVNTLDDYREGNWTPAITGDGGGSGQVYAAQAGTYIKIGKLVNAFFFVQLSAKGTITGNVIISGLPFTSDAASQFPVSPVLWSLATGWVNVIGAVSANTAVISMRGAIAGAASNNTTLTTADVSNATFFGGMMTYQASA
jgi:hypothetical protein